MEELIPDPKQALRQQCKQIRRALGEQTRQRASQTICAQIEAWTTFQRAETILTYMPMRGEVDLRSLLERQPAKRWVLPRIIPEEGHRMVFQPYDPANLVVHAFGMAEPAPDLPKIPPAEIQLTLVPGLAFDRQGWRLGYGGGYFDRFLKDYAGVSLGVIFGALLLDSLPHTAFDMSIEWLVTEGEFLKALSV
jgi:5-formyltetrahydrofolate cyclo-ligase